MCVRVCVCAHVFHHGLISYFELILVLVYTYKFSVQFMCIPTCGYFTRERESDTECSLCVGCVGV